MSKLFRVIQAIIILAATILPLYYPITPHYALATSTTADIVLHVRGGGLFAPTDFEVIRITDTEVLINWVKNASANNTMIRVAIDHAPATINDGYLVYYGTGDNTTDYSVNLDVVGGEYIYRAWSEDTSGIWSIDYAEGSTGGIGMTLIGLVILAIGLTISMFHTKNALLGYPSAIMWAVLGGYAYIESAAPWQDWQYYLAIASLLGMVPFTIYAAFGLREKRDSIAEVQMEKGDGKYIDEVKKPVSVEPRISKRAQAIRDRAAARRNW